MKVAAWVEAGLRDLALRMAATPALVGSGIMLAHASGERARHAAQMLPPPSSHGAKPSSPDEVDESHVESWQLVEKAQQGDGEAYGRLYDRYFDAIYRYVYFRVGDRALAEDFTSETFLRALRRIGQLTYQGRDVGAWFTTIARNIVFDHSKSARNRLEVVTDAPIEPGESVASTESAVLGRLTSERLVAAVNQLSTDQRECIVLRFLQGMSVGETADVMGKNDGAIKALQYRAVRKLGEIVGAPTRTRGPGRSLKSSGGGTDG